MPYNELPKNIPKEEYIERIMAGLGCDRAEAEDVYKYDMELEDGRRAEFDLTPDKEAIAKKMAHTGTRERKQDDPKKPFVPKLDTRKRKPNATKGTIIAALAKFLQETEDFCAEEVSIEGNGERMIKFGSGGERFELVLTQKRKPKA